jgi:hypothetical protein
MHVRLLIMMTALMSVATYPVVAQDMGQTGNGGGRAAAARAPNGVHTGQRVPTPSALGPNETGSIQRRTRNDEQIDTITKGICIGCSR